MTVTPALIAVELGVAAPDSGSVLELQWQSWIDQALYLIGKRLDIATLNPEDVDYVVLQSAAAHARHPGGETQVSVSVDDGSVSKTYRSGAGRVSILPELWGLLDPDMANESGVGSTLLYGEADSSTPDTWVSTTP